MKLLTLFLSFVHSQVVSIRDNDWKAIMEGKWFVEFYAPWCPACKQLTPVYKELSEYSDELGVQFADCDITKNHALSGRFLITALPTLFFCEDGTCRKYDGSRDLDTLHAFLQDEKWRGVEPVAWWRQPTGWPMTAVSLLFIFSSQMQIFHEYLTIEIVVNEYASYGLYFLLTVVTGLFLGGVLVVVADFWSKLTRSPAKAKLEPPVEEKPVTEQPESDGDKKVRRRVRKD